MAGLLKVQGTKIVDTQGYAVVLKGAGIGGHMNMENFITGYPGQEAEHKEALLKAMGQEKFDYFFDKFYEYFWTDKDAEFFKSLNLNCLRIPFNYRHFVDDADLFTIKPKGFALLDRIVDICAKHEIYVILDLHAVPGGQNQDWHSDSGIHKALFFQFSVFQDSMIHLWKEIASHYAGNPWIAGYNPLNEPADSKHHRLVEFYIKVEKAIREVDPDHIIYLDANTYAMDFSQFPATPFPNTVYAIHDYSVYGFPGTGDHYSGTPEEKQNLLKLYSRKIEYMKQKKVPVWNGEFGPVYASEARGDINYEKANQRRYQVLKDQLAIYKTGDPSGDGAPISWSIWLYKDIGYQAITYVSPKSKWFQVLGDFLLKKQKLGLDKWGRDADPEVEKIYDRVKAHFHEAIPQEFHKLVYPNNFGIDNYVDRVLREMLLSQYMGYEFADLFKGLDFAELDELAASFKFENLETRDDLNKYLSEY
ncbi:glycoside hydrolase family 5 protein [Babjeviella inositovora NRRL Y-12698]|uniref:Glycoside hydrolase family 5 protein n=1 Tax=Babjeviella inositovora NRRL Y-12698 TaxID=984486 RepID=A0A1E3QVJ5_9ASCO|nr:glycoside hydrolase family 5 protein [Babjeviella inositovora NRRL Y-12698]ODQ80987.1 glycoside hydrolase family 5 protein [Babjeviella inositovora NRRL Y-12698]